jgi:helicase MOV-10
VKLVKNFRSHEAILKFPNNKFYNGDLEVCGDRRHISRFIGSNILVNKKFPIIFHGIIGKDDREASSPSFFNVDEILEVKSYVEILKQKYRISMPPFFGMGFCLRFSAIIADHDIGIITPYHAQVLKIRASLKAVADQVKVGSTEEFQGQVSIRTIIIYTRPYD